MNRLRRFTRWAVTVGAGLAIAAGFALSNRQVDGQPRLPAAAHYGSLPEVFNRLLDETRSKIGDPAADPETVRVLARLYHANRLYSEARACYQLIAGMAPGLTARDHYLLADIAQNTNDLTAAQIRLRVVLELDPLYVPARLALGQALFKSGDGNEAEREFAAIVAIKPEHPQASLGLARILLQRGDDDSAVERLEELIAAHPQSTSAAAVLAQVLERRGETDRAIALHEWSLQRPEPIPADPWMWELVAHIYDVQLLGLKFEDYFKTGQVDEAMVFLRRVEELEPGSPVASLLRGSCEAQARRHREAVPYFRQALAKGGDPEKICPALVESLLALDNVDEAVELMADFSARMPDSIPVTLAYSEVLVRQGDDVRAREVLAKVLEKQPYLYAQNMAFARILWLDGDREAAATCLHRVAEIYSQDMPSRALLGEYFLDRSDPLSAVPPLEQAIALAVSSSPLRKQLTVMLGTAYLQAAGLEEKGGNLPTAADYFEKAIGIAPDDLRGYAGKANACVQLRQFRRAAEALEKMASLQPENPTIFLSLGDVLFKDGQREQAARHWEKALQLTTEADTELRSALSDRMSGRLAEEIFK